MSKDDILGATLSGRRGFKKKSSKGWWSALAFLLVLGATVAGFQYGGKELLKQYSDERAVKTIELPVTDPSVTKRWMQDIGKGRNKVYTAAVTLEVGYPGLECLYTVLGPTCNWAKYNAEQEVAQ